MAEWSSEEDEKIKKWRGEGLSCTVMAARLGNGRSRNAVIGRLARLGLRYDRPNSVNRRVPRHRPSVQREARSAPPRPRAPIFSAMPMPADRVVRPVGAPRVTVENAEPHHCRFVHGDPVLQPNTWTFCGEPKAAVGVTSFCEAHHMLAYAGVTPSARDPAAVARVRSRNKTASEIARVQKELAE